jgi:hypothetical protein
MYEDKMDNPWFQKMALLETLTDEEKIQLYPKEYPMILLCSRIPEQILQRVLSNEATILEQLHFLSNDFIGDAIIKVIYKNTPHKYVRERAYGLLYEKEKDLQIGLEIIRKLSSN